MQRFSDKYLAETYHMLNKYVSLLNGVLHVKEVKFDEWSGCVYTIIDSRLVSKDKRFADIFHAETMALESFVGGIDFRVIDIADNYVEVHNPFSELPETATTIWGNNDRLE